MTPAGLFVFLSVFSGIQSSGFSDARFRREEPFDEAYTEDVKNQLMAGIKDVRKSAEKALEYNSKAAGLASQMATQAAEIRKTLSVDDADSRSGSDQINLDEKNSIGSDPAEAAASLSQIDAQVNYKLYAARRDFGWAQKIGQRTAEMLRVFSKESADPEKNRYYEQRGGLQKQALQQLVDYQKSLQKIRISVTKLKNLEASFKDATEKDFCQIAEWKADGSAALSLVKQLKTDLFLKAYRETEKTDYFIENAEQDSESEAQSRSSCPFGGCRGYKFTNLDPYGIGVGSGLGSEYDSNLPLNEIVKEAASEFQTLTSASPRSITLIKCLVKSIFTFLSEMYTCLQSDGSEGPGPVNPPEPSFYLPFKAKPNPKFAANRNLMCALRPIFNFIFGIITCMLS